MGGEAPPAELKQIEVLYAAIATAIRSAAGFEATYGGTAIVIARSSMSARPALLVCRETGRHGLPTLHLAPGEAAVWDRRFDVRLTDAARSSVTVGALGAAGFSALRRGHPEIAARPHVARAAATLPAFRRGDQLVAVPFFGRVLPGEFAASDAGRGADPADEADCLAQPLGGPRDPVPDGGHRFHADGDRP
jgi:hypothetical protein